MSSRYFYMRQQICKHRSSIGLLSCVYTLRQLFCHVCAVLRRVRSIEWERERWSFGIYCQRRIWWSNLVTSGEFGSSTWLFTQNCDASLIESAKVSKFCSEIPFKVCTLSCPIIKFLKLTDCSDLSFKFEYSVKNF